MNSESDDLDKKCEKFIEGLAGCFYDGLSGHQISLNRDQVKIAANTLAEIVREAK